MNRLKVSSVNELRNVAKIILEKSGNQRVFCFFGRMGAGKTTLIKAFCEVLGSVDVVNSPTFSIVNEYEREDGSSIFHFDFYRINKQEEVYDIGFDEYLESGDYCLMEWPELIMELLPDSYVKVSIEEEYNENRIIYFNTIQH